MSLIHEALQKAEAERRAGELPPLLSSSGLVPHRKAAARTRWLWFVPVVVLVAALGYSNKELLLGGEPAPESSSPTQREAIAPPAVEVATAVKPAQVRAQPQVVLPGIPEGTMLAAADDVASEPVATAEPAPPMPAPIPLSPSAASSEPSAATESANAPAASTPELVEDEPITAVDAPTPPPAIAEVTVPPAQDPQPQTESKTVPEASTSGSLPYIYELPLATRQALPTLKVTMQVYHQDPSQRFAIIDGKRVNENGPVGNDLNLIEIQRDAMVFQFRGARFLLPRLGR